MKSDLASNGFVAQIMSTTVYWIFVAELMSTCVLDICGRVNVNHCVFVALIFVAELMSTCVLGIYGRVNVNHCVFDLASNGTLWHR